MAVRHRQSTHNRESSGKASERSRLEQMFEEDGHTLLATLNHFVDVAAAEGVRASDLESCQRAVHSLKSEADFLEYPDVTSACHDLETQLVALQDEVRGEGSSANEDRLQRVTSAVARIDDCVKRRIRSLSDLPDSSGSEKSVDQSLTGVIRYDQDPVLRIGERELIVLRESWNQGESLYRIRLRLSDSEPLTYARLYLVLNNLEAAATVLATNPGPEQLPNSSGREFTALVTASCSEQQIYEALSVDQLEQVELEPLDYEAVIDMASAEDRHGPGMLLGTGGVTLSLTARNYEIIALYSHELTLQLEATLASIDRGTANPSEIRRSLRAARTIADRVNQGIDRTSLVPLSRVFDPLSEFVVRTGEELGKNVKLRVEGEREQVSLPVAEVLSEVLLHLLRNSIDHGIESPQERNALDKPDPARITVRAGRRGGALYLSVRDDGRGVNVEGLRMRASRSVRERGTLLDLVSTPGLSIRTEADEHSGRGVGMDGVRHSVEQLLGGTLSFESETGQGVTVSLTLPERANLLTVLVFETGDRYIAVPSCQVLETFSLDAKRVRQDAGGDSYYVHNDWVARIFRLSNEGSAVEHYDGSGVLIGVEKRRGVILADRLISEELVVRRPSDRNRVFSRSCNDLVSLFIPVSL